MLFLCVWVFSKGRRVCGGFFSEGEEEEEEEEKIKTFWRKKKKRLRFFSKGEFSLKSSM